jgi:hypothetical protein
MERTLPKSWIFAGLITLGIAARLMPHPWNASPLTAIALFAGAFGPRRWAVLIPWLCVAVSDLFLGFHQTMFFTWSGFISIGCLGWWLRSRLNAPRLIAASVCASTLFFLWTNLGVWLVGGLYPASGDGLILCYTAGLPFYRTALVGDLVYSLALFGSFGWVMRRSLSLSPALCAKP